jgi:hypothetical protein
LIKIEFHCHTEFSSDSLASIEGLYQAAKDKGLDRIVVTDHNRIDGALLAVERAPELFIAGEEVMTSEGELLAAFVKEKIPRGLEPIDAIKLLREQGAFISVSHPFDYNRPGSWELEQLKRITPYVDAIEVFNSRCVKKVFNKRAEEFARNNGLLGTVGSDAHSIRELGQSTINLHEFTDAASLKQALTSASFETKISAAWVHFYSTWAKIRKR